MPTQPTMKKQKQPMKNRNHRRRLAQETVEILESGYLQGQSIQHLIEASVQETVSYPEWATMPTPMKLTDKPQTTQFSVINTTTLQAAHSLVQEHPNTKVTVLNFASARNPGGGFLNGSLAQEESLALHSGLYACLKGDKMYPHHQNMRGGIYSDWCIWSPDVPVFREERGGGRLLETPWLVSVITCPCLNKSAIQKHASMTDTELEPALRKRMIRFLSAVAAHHEGNLVLGAWGCGVFGNDPTMIARLFAEVLALPAFQNRWPRIVFAVLDTTKHGRTIAPFKRIFEER